MSKAMKKFLLFLTLLCLVVLIIFCYQLFIEPGKVTPPAESSPPASETPAEQSPAQTPSETPAEETPSVSEQPQEEPSPVETDARFEMPLTEDMLLTYFVDMSEFSRAEQELGDVFTYQGGQAWLELSFVDAPDGASSLSSSFLDNYIDYTGGEITYGGLSPVGNSELAGFFVSAAKGSETVSAWLINLESGAVFAIVIRYHSSAEHAALYAILDSLAIEPMNENAQ